MTMTDKERRTKKYMADQRYKKKLERQAKEIQSYPGPAYLVDERWNGKEYMPLEKPYIRKIYKSSHADRYRYYKNIGNRKIRREGRVLPKGAAYKKAFDYQYTVD